MRNKISTFIPLLLLLLTSCHNRFYDKYDFEFGIETNISEYVIHDTKNIIEEDYFKFHGRHYLDDAVGVRFFNFSSSGLEVTFIGTTIEANIYTTNANDNKSRPYIAVCVDNDYDPDHSTPIQLTSGKYSNSTGKDGNYYVHPHVVLAHDLPYGEHTIRIYKRSECLPSKFGIKSLSCDGEIIPVKAKDLGLKLEFYGDSVTCGYAVESDDFYENFSTRTENSMRTYANYAANILNADISHISCGGYPMYKSKYSQGCTPDTIPEMLSLASVDYQTTQQYVWDNTSYIPDYVIVALGANDGSMIQNYNDKDNRVVEFVGNFKTATINFINSLLNIYEETTIIISDEIIPIRSILSNTLDDVVNEFNSIRVKRIKYSAYESAENRVLPGNGHPNEEMHKIAGIELANFINNLSH